MAAMSPDAELVGAYVAEGSETAFRTLVARHATLVYSTALRQVGDSGIAEEITQNVFLALARKAPRLAGMSTLAGWLHRTTLLECKTRIRTEVRRRTREETAAALAALEHEKDESHGQLIPLVDEALLQLREADRIALMLRYCENQSLS
ncbi:MAG: RNA polymerase sigma factor, partial [Limisphaerales bacterium]